MEKLPYLIDTPRLDGDKHLHRILKLMYEYPTEFFTSVRFINCSNSNQYFDTLEDKEMNLTSSYIIPKSNGTKKRFIAKNQMERVKEYLEQRGLISIQDEANRSN